jgi:predicted DNA-binding protein YlxM (UPF0122 family)
MSYKGIPLKLPMNREKKFKLEKHGYTIYIALFIKEGTMSQISLKQFEMLDPEKQKSILSQMKKELGVNGILEQWNISRSKYYSILKKIKTSSSSIEGKSEVSGNAEGDNKIFANSEDASIIAQNKQPKTGQKFSISINNVLGTKETLTSTLQYLSQFQISPSSNMRISIQIEEI